MYCIGCGAIIGTIDGETTDEPKNKNISKKGTKIGYGDHGGHGAQGPGPMGPKGPRGLRTPWSLRARGPGAHGATGAHGPRLGWNHHGGATWGPTGPWGKLAIDEGTKYFFGGGQ